MSVYSYKKYKISLNADTAKVQGLKCGDIVRRQYFDGMNTIYSLMCVLESGVDTTGNDKCPYFIGALLEGTIPATGELLDFARITNLFDESRGGALYLTSSDSNSPYIDVIDGIARNKALCYPVSLGTTDYTDPTTQYIIGGDTYVTAAYKQSDADNYRVCTITKNSSAAASDVFIGIKQEFCQYIENPNRVLISYKIKSSKNITATVSLEYTDGTRTDGSLTTDVTTDWQYKFHTITVDYSGRYLRVFKLNINNSLVDGDVVEISDLNVILLSSVSNYGESSQTRIGKVSGIVDPVFGTLSGYGGYMQRLYASKSAHISGTLTAGDEDGFAATFYAGRIHRNAFVNSLLCDGFSSGVTINSELSSPTGVGNVWNLLNNSSVKAQKNEWLLRKVGTKYTFSFWAYSTDAGTIVISQNGVSIGTINIAVDEVEIWKRQSVTFKINTSDADLTFAFSTALAKFSITSPQLEIGSDATQYQPTDEVLDETEDFGAWMNRGGIGGTIQNPLLKLNYDGKGAIGSRTGSFLLNADGSGNLANGNIKWTSAGSVTFGTDVSLSWSNLESDVQSKLLSKSIKIIGTDTFVLDNSQCAPASIALSLDAENITLSSSTFKWSYLSDSTWTEIQNATSSTLTVLPSDSYWNSLDSLTLKCVVTYNQTDYSDTITIKKQYNQGYTLEVASSNGATFKNGTCDTVLSANVYYNGTLITDTSVINKFTFTWEKYTLVNGVMTKDDSFSQTGKTITISGTIDAQVMYSCAMS